ncbi:hypothetical protein BASA83_009538 [Batrachochytrium salamandrivorans]|nr:hypothetical protein BASA62_008788 [Batrachochytrium salamandrivorans]KAH9268146.1 hypothetical protein BASA83_009538 [Batrachochytrium salamandrivorans]
MKLISFAALSFLAITVSAYPRLSTGAQRGQQSQGATSQSEQQYQDDADPNEHEDPRESLQDTLMELNEDYKKRQAAVGQLQGIIDEMEKEKSDVESELNDPNRLDKEDLAQEFFAIKRYLIILQEAKRDIEIEMAGIKHNYEHVKESIAGLDEMQE